VFALAAASCTERSTDYSRGSQACFLRGLGVTEEVMRALSVASYLFPEAQPRLVTTLKCFQNDAGRRRKREMAAAIRPARLFLNAKNPSSKVKSSSL
jgi:hypothetical protein